MSNRKLLSLFTVLFIGWSSTLFQGAEAQLFGENTSGIREPRSFKKRVCKKYGICNGGFQGQGGYGGFQGGHGGYPTGGGGGYNGYPPINIGISQSQSSASNGGGGYGQGYYPNNYQYNYPNQGYGGYQRPGYGYGFGNGYGGYNNQFNGNYYGQPGGYRPNGGFGFGPYGDEIEHQTDDHRPEYDDVNSQHDGNDEHSDVSQQGSYNDAYSGAYAFAGRSNKE